MKFQLFNFKISLCFQELTLKGNYYSNISTILSGVSLCIPQHTLKHICYLYSILHFVIFCKLQHTLHYTCWNFDTPTECLALYSKVHFTKQTVVLKFQLGLSKSHFVFESTNQKETITVKFQLSSNMSNFAFPSTL